MEPAKTKEIESDEKHNNPGLGAEYEVYIPAYFALRLNNNPEIKDFKLQSNVPGFKNLDDLLVDITFTTKSKENLCFAFQLKHKENSDKMINLSLKKYCEAFKNLSEENRKKYHFILYTNNFKLSDIKLKKFDMKKDEDCLGINFFNTSGNGKPCSKFEVKKNMKINEKTQNGEILNKKDYEEFFSKFSLYTGQASIRNLAKSILDILRKKECYATYIDFFRKWHRGDFIDCNNKILDKKTLNVHLVDILLSPFAINYHLSDGQDENTRLFEEMVQHFDITIIDASKEDFIKLLEENVLKYPGKINKKEDLIRFARNHKFIDGFAEELKEGTKVKLLHYFHQKPLILDFNESSKDLIYKASDLCRIQETGIKLVIIGKNIDVSRFSHLKTFTNLSGVVGMLLQQTEKKCKLSLQGRNILLKDISDIREHVTPRDIFQMLTGNFLIGEDKENLPQYCIPRIVSTKFFDIESIIKHSSESVAIIFYSKDKQETLIRKIVDSEKYLSKYTPDAIIFRPKIFFKVPTIILQRKQLLQLADIRNETEKDNVHLFKVIDEKNCLLLMSTNITLISENKNYKYTNMPVEENNIHDFFNNSINILCAEPGMGKSTLMKYLKNECATNFWTVKVDLKAHNQFLKRTLDNPDDIKKVLEYFLELENRQDLFLWNIKRMFLRKEKIVFFLDGLDEVENECVDCVLNITSQLSEMGFKIWLSSRQNLQQKIEQYFNIFTIEMGALNKDQQENYMRNRLMQKWSNKKEIIEKIVEKIFKRTDLINNNCRQILKIPLQLQIITETFVGEKSHFFNLSENNNFILTKIFEMFEGKYEHFVSKFDTTNPHLFKRLEEQLEKIYEILALHSVLDNEDFKKLQMEKLKLPQIKNWDFLGIITEVNKENKVVFEHSTYAEYFASKFLVKYIDDARIFQILAEKYPNLILNELKAEGSPLMNCLK